MRLKSLELKGFKSFANETVIHFDQDVIGIVGPNGSGKSNIVDAIRWVLGEQKGKELRLDSMSDVLFNGTKKRRPGGLAQVSITFENTRNLLPTEYQTVTISRLLFRSGDSEYRLNGVTCRLKDIQSLLVDSGIGSNSYAIIALGMVDDILHNKENARRRMFEQAAGISKYKKRKRETILKLKSTSADLERVEDLLFEIEGNLKMLEKQARRAKRYIDLKLKYKDLAVDLALHKSEHLNGEFKSLQKQIDTELDLHRQLEADLRKFEARLQEVKKDNIDEEKLVGSKQRELNILVGQIRGLENDKSLKEQESAFLSQSVKKLKTQVAEHEKRLSGLDLDLKQKASELQKSAARADALYAQLKEARDVKEGEEKRFQQARENRDEVNRLQTEYEGEYVRLEKELSTHDANIAQLESLISGYDDEREEVLKQLSEKGDECKVLKSRRDQLETEVRMRLESEEKRQLHMEDLQVQLKHMEEESGRLGRLLDAKTNERDLLRDMIEKLEGYPESIKYLNKSGNWKRHAPLLSDVIYCEAEHRPKVEFLLEAHLNDYIADSAEEALEAVNLLTGAQKGRARFFILDRMQAAAPTAQTIPESKPILDLIQCDEKYLPVAHYLFANAFVTNGRPTAEQIEEARKANATLISQDGTVIVSGCAISGGSTGLFEGKKLGRKKNLEKLNKEISRLEKEVRSLREQADAMHLEIQLVRASDKTAEVSDLRNALQNTVEALSRSGAQLEQLEASAKGLLDRAERDQKLLEQTRVEKQLTIQRIGELKRKITAESAKWQTADSQYSALMSSYSEANMAFNKANTAYLQIKSHLESVEREMQFSSRRREEVNQQLDRDREQIETDLSNIGKLEAELNEIEDALIDLYAGKKSSEKELTAAEQAYFGARNQIDELEGKIRNKNREVQNSQYMINELKEKHSDIRFKLASVNERMQIEFNISLSEVDQRQPDPAISTDKLEEKVTKLRARLENFGEVNPMAVEAYDEMKERYDTINAQKLDILEAKESLLETIKEIEDTATRIFVEAFAQIRGYFIEVFRSLFTEGDTCDLILEDPSNPLESNIRIIAKPKGKRPKSLSQLSGGEKTLTATALLFALYLLKPAPFCVFDEVDAPLDDANIEKFNKIIKKFSSDSQFVIVTHNKQTMAAVDVIYGVYMEEQGISALSPVDFRYLDEVVQLETAEG